MDKGIIIAIEGMAASGKTTLAEKIRKTCDSNIFHTDDFFLPPSLKTKERLSQPGGNFHYERFYTEIIENILRGKEFSYNAYSCKTQSYNKIHVSPKLINIIEGSYSAHPYFIDNLSKIIFLETTLKKQLQRISERGQSQLLETFKNLWIPLENYYFEFYKIRERAHEIIKT